jgi:hypothetical protein
MLVQDEWGWFFGTADRYDSLDDLMRFLKAVCDLDGLEPMTFAINDSSGRRNSASGCLPDRQSTEANEKFVGLVALVPGRIEKRDIAVTGLTSLGPVPDAPEHERWTVASVRHCLTVDEPSGLVAGGFAYQPQEIH